MTTHDHDGEIAKWGLCRVCAGAGLGDVAEAPAGARQLVFDGETFDPERDAGRLGQQMLDVLTVVADGRWHSLAGISHDAGHPEASVSARLRDLRKPRFGGHEIARRRAADGGAHEYRLVPRST